MQEQVQNKDEKKNGKLLWYGWRVDCAEHFGVSERTVDSWRKCEDRGTKVAMNKIKLKRYCHERLVSAGDTDAEASEKIKEAFGNEFE